MIFDRVFYKIVIISKGVNFMSKSDWESLSEAIHSFLDGIAEVIAQIKELLASLKK